MTKQDTDAVFRARRRLAKLYSVIYRARFEHHRPTVAYRQLADQRAMADLTRMFPAQYRGLIDIERAKLGLKVQA